MFADVRHALRGFRREPGFTAVAAVSVGLAIGVNSAIFSVADGLWFRPPGVRSPNEIARIFSTSRQSAFGGFSWPEYRDIAARSEAFTGVVALGRRGSRLHVPGGPPEMLLANVVSDNFFEVLGVRALAGRTFEAADRDMLRRQPVVVLGHAFWQRQFGSDLGIVGKTIPLGRKTPIPVLVAGVLPPSFRDLNPSGDRDVWFPVATWAAWDSDPEADPRQYRWFELLARRKNGIGVERAEAELETIAAGWAAQYPADNAGRSIRAVSDLRYRLNRGGPASLALFGVVILVVLITCVNVANLLLARAARRSKEIAVRAALGAGRGRLLRQLFLESATLGSLGTLLGIGLTGWLVSLVPAILVSPPGYRSSAVFAIDARVFLFTVVAAFITVLLFGLAPALAVVRSDITAVFKADSGRAAVSIRRSALWNGLVGSQVAVAVVLLCTTATVLRSFAELVRAELGFARKPLVLAYFSGAILPRDGALSMAGRIRSTAGVRDVAIAFRAPLSLSGGGMAERVFIDGTATDPRAGLPEIKMNAVSSSYFRVVGTKLLRGREFTDADQFGGEAVAILSEQFARRYFGSLDIVGRSISVGGPGQSPTRIVGVAANAVINNVSESPEPYLYLPYWKQAYGDLTMLIEPEGASEPVLSSLQAVFRSMDRSSQPHELTTLPTLVTYNTSRERMLAIFVGILGALGVLLTCVGVYGVVAYGVTQRTQEIGVRMALGATGRDTVLLIFLDGLRVLLFGVLAGVPLALIATSALKPLLFGIRPWDIPSLAAAVLLLSLFVVLASIVPALRASRANPAGALRASY